MGKWRGSSFTTNGPLAIDNISGIMTCTTSSTKLALVVARNGVRPAPRASLPPMPSVPIRVRQCRLVVQVRGTSFIGGRDLGKPGREQACRLEKLHGYDDRVVSVLPSGNRGLNNRIGHVRL